MFFWACNVLLDFGLTDRRPHVLTIMLRIKVTQNLPVSRGFMSVDILIKVVAQ